MRDRLKADGPAKAIADMQEQHGLRLPLCRPLLRLMDHLGVPRRECHEHVLERARALLLDRVRALAARQAAAARAGAAAAAAGDARGAAAAARDEEHAQSRLEALLAAAFPYLGLPELRAVPLEVLACMERVPAPFLKLLAEDREVFALLPQRVKQQVWEHDKGLLQSVAIETIATYKYEAATVVSCLDMRPFVGQRPLWQDDDREEGGGGGGAGGGGGGAGGARPGSSGGGAVGGGAPLPPRPGSGRPGLGGAGGQRAGGAGGFQLSSLLSKIGGGGGGDAKPGQQQRPGGAQLRPGGGGPPPRRAPGPGGSPARGASPASGGAPPPPAAAGFALDRRRLRAGSDAVKRLRAMVGGSARIYAALVELCEVRLHASDAPYLSLKELSYCALRTQLLMALHDAGADVGALRARDACFDLVWALDAATSARRIGASHLRQLQALFRPYQPR